MKISDYKIDAFLKANPDAESIPINEIKEEEPEITIADIMKKLTDLEAKINAPAPVDEPPKEEPKEEPKDDKSDVIAALAEEVKALKEGAQRKAIEDSELPKEQTADDILKSFIGGN